MCGHSRYPAGVLDDGPSSSQLEVPQRGVFVWRLVRCWAGHLVSMENPGFGEVKVGWAQVGA